MNKSHSVALGGIFLSLSIVTLYFESILPTGKLTLLALSSFYVSFVVLESGIKAGLMFYIASALLSFVLIPSKMDILLYIFFFGCYPLVKYYAETIGKRPLELALKIVFFNIMLALGFFFAKELLFAQLKLDTFKYPMIVFFAVAQVVFILYDYAFSTVIRYYVTRRPR